MSVAPIESQIHYPDSDGNPVADNTLQYEWIVKLKSNIEFGLRNEPQVFIAADLLWYPVQGRPDIRRAPDVLVAFGRPKGYRGSYRQWEEADIAPQVVIEVLSPNNRALEMAQKLAFYDQYGVEEYCMIEPDPENLGVVAWQRKEGRLVLTDQENRWQSARLDISVAVEGDQLVARDADGKVFRSPEEVRAREEELEALTNQQAEEIERLREELERLKGKE